MSNSNIAIIVVLAAIALPVAALIPIARHLQAMERKNAEIRRKQMEARRKAQEAIARKFFSLAEKPSASETKKTGISDLEGLAKLRDRGIVTEEEFAAKKRQLLGL